MKLVVGLGNPGPEYARTRHNVGFEVVDSLARRFVDPSRASARARFHGLVLEAEIASEMVLLIKPTTFMNKSGRSVADAISFYKLDAARDVMVVADDIDLPCGTIRVRADGGTGGHNGLADILGALGSAQWSRCRIGIDPPGIIPQADYVLGRFTAEQQPLASQGIDLACEALECWCREGLAATMNRFNRSRVTNNA
ncbi:MAG: aminoacyl-tRNA hydrolase [Phycisphaerales bacterium]|nr:aminoacyl-tRNA hydrolase [Phycisphaerales bacterium]